MGEQGDKVAKWLVSILGDNKSVAATSYSWPTVAVSWRKSAIVFLNQDLQEKPVIWNLDHLEEKDLNGGDSGRSSAHNQWVTGSIASPPPLYPWERHFTHLMKRICDGSVF